ncbi:MAG: hypothetical protein KKA42_08335 [candidate division Zixibacteria bacterium]|nr:hypothetical protein [candidate division Zixibacteria bacterium]
MRRFSCFMGLLLLICLVTRTHAHDGYWIDRTPLPEARQEIYPSVLEGKVYVVGGYTSSLAVSADVFVYDPEAGTWDTAAALPAPRHHCLTVPLDGKLYAIGGYTGPSLPWIASADVWMYDPAINEWIAVASLNRSRGEHSGVAFDDRIYVFGGNNAFGDDLASVEMYDPTQDVWTEVTTMPTARHHSGVAVLDSLIYVVGGRIGYWGESLTLIGVLEAYAPGSDTWYSLPDMLTPRSALAADCLDGKLYTFGGEIPDIYDESEEYDPVTQTWRSLTPMLTGRHGTAAALVGDTVFIVGGAHEMGAGASDANEGFVLGTCADTDLDGYADVPGGGNTCPGDNCPNKYNPVQADHDSDGIGDSCDVCPADPYDDGDGDLLCGDVDNCSNTYNPGQEDTDGDGVGDACCCVGLTGNVDGDSEDVIDIGDLTALIEFLFITFVSPGCPHEANVDGVADVDIGDLTALIDYLFITFADPAACL